MDPWSLLQGAWRTTEILSAQISNIPAFCPSAGRHKIDPLCLHSCTGPGPAVSSVRICPTRVATERAWTVWARHLVMLGNAVSIQGNIQGDEIPPGLCRPVRDSTDHPETFFPKRAGSYMHQCHREARPVHPPVNSHSHSTRTGSCREQLSHPVAAF